MEIITVSMVKLRHNLTDYIELAQAGNVITVMNARRNKVVCLLVAPSFLPETALETAPDAGMGDELDNR